MSEPHDLHPLLAAIVDDAVSLVGAERGLLVLVDKNGQSCIRMARGRDLHEVNEDQLFAHSIVCEVADTLVPRIETVQSAPHSLTLSRSAFDLMIRSVMCVPLVSHSACIRKVLGLLYVDSRLAVHEFDQRDLKRLEAHSQRISIAFQNAGWDLDGPQ